MVTRPAVPPYSSTTIATWVRRACISAQQVVGRLGVRDIEAVAHDDSTRSVDSASWLSKTRFVTSLR